MKYLIAFFLVLCCISCDKVIDIKLPAYEPQLVVEMYLENGKALRCLLTESLPYTDTTINRPVDRAEVIVSDGTRTYRLQNGLFQDAETGRYYNYFATGIFRSDTSKTYTLKITDTMNRTLTASTRFSQPLVRIDSIATRASATKPDSISVGVRIKDPAESENYYRFYVSKRLRFNEFDPTDFSLNDVSFNGELFSFYSEPSYAIKDTVTVRVYSLHKDHYLYRESVREARRANFNPFSQPGTIKSNVSGGLGIFTTIRYDQRRIIIQ